MSPKSLAGQLADALANSWRAQARPTQLPPEGEWGTWLILAGRGWGKTRTGAEWVREQVDTRQSRRIALIASTAGDVRDVVVEGPSGILATASDWNRPEYEPSKRRLTWPNGAVATTFSADEPDRLRGPQFDCAWCDELAAWAYPELAWSMLQMGLRIGTRPRCVITSTPRPIKLLKELLAREGQDVVVTRGSTFENAANLAPPFLAAIKARYEGTRLGRQELNAEVLSDTPGALWQRDWIDRDRVSVVPELRRVVVAIDPAASSGEGADETGIVVAGVAGNGHAYVLADMSGRFAPHDWAARAVAAYRQHQADRIIAEKNNGGEMVEATIRTVDANVSFRAVHASRGKVTRAEPISALYEQGKVHHVGSFPELEDQCCDFVSDFDKARSGYSPDRVDALVWALTELMPSYVEEPVEFFGEVVLSPYEGSAEHPALISRLQRSGGGMSWGSI
jgi:predicted phage terminase large subunit-like protein